jgi:hypothetical protein
MQVSPLGQILLGQFESKTQFAHTYSERRP